METQETVPDLKQVLGIFQENETKPVLPVNQLQQLKDRFARLDEHSAGVVDLAVVANDLELHSSADVATYDIDSDGCVDINEFLRIMCPPGYRLPEMAGFARDIFGTI